MEEKVKTVSVRPKTSPYLTSPITVYVGVDRQRYYVHRALLQKLENIPSRSPWASEVILGELDPDTGHTLIHFLHTGAYQTLNKTDEDYKETNKTEIAIDEFKKAVRVSKAATRYRLLDLQQLAQAEMEWWGAEMNLRDTVLAISEDSIADSLDPNTWLRNHVSQKVKSTFELTPEMFSGPDFFERITSPTLIKILAQELVGMYSRKVSDLQKEHPADQPADETIPSPITVADMMVVEETEQLESAPEKVDHVWTSEKQDDSQNTVDEIHIVEPAEPINEVVEDRADRKKFDLAWSDWGSVPTSSAKKKKKQGVAWGSETSAVTAAETEPEPPLELAPESATDSLPAGLAPEPVATVEIPPAENEKTSWVPKRKKSKKAKKGMRNVAPPSKPEPEPEPRQPWIQI